MKKLLGILLIPALFASAYYGGQWLQTRQQPLNIQLERIDAPACDPSIAVCEIHIQNHKVRLHFKQKPSALEPFTVVLETDLNDIEQIGLRFYMQGMDMGYNLFEMEKQGQGFWQKDSILPVCSTGSKDWRLELQLLKGDRLWVSDFSFRQN